MAHNAGSGTRRRVSEARQEGPGRRRYRAPADGSARDGLAGARLRLALLGWCMLLLSGCVTVVPVPDIAAPAASQAQAAWARVLATHVDAHGHVDFRALAAAPDDLEAYVAYVAATDPASLPDADTRLAHYLNSYNALSMHNVIASGLPATHAGLNKVRFFYLRRFTIGGQRLSLYAYENEIIRPLGDPRVHFALNCSAVSCPTLPRLPFTATAIDAELTAETRRFLNDPRHVRVEDASRRVLVSEILDFYTEDFVPAHAASLHAYINRYRDTPLPEDYAIAFIPYDWTVAHQRR